MMEHYDVIIVGGGITGAGTARDCAMRGLSTLLVERYDFTSGATGRNHGLMHSGARYAVTDNESAAECMRENLILRHIARHCVEETDGLFISLPDDDLEYQSTLVAACRRAGIRADVISPEEAKAIEPVVNPELIGAVRVPDCSIDPFSLTTANVIDARRHGARTLTYHEVVEVLLDGTRVVGVKLRDNNNGALSTVYCDILINAAGIWGTLIARMAGVKVGMLPAKGALLIFANRLNNMVINRCRQPSNADILVPDDTVCVLGTTSNRVPLDTIDDMHVTPEEIDILLRDGAHLVPRLATARILRAYAGVRPLVADDDDPTGRSISRGIVLLDHATRDGLDGFITITGGKMMTYRLMAEKATSLACQKLGRNVECSTASLPLPGSEVNLADTGNGPRYTITMNKAAQERHGTLTAEISEATGMENRLVCECERVTVGEVKFAIEKLGVRNLTNLRRRTRVGMGPCQGKMCAIRAASLLCHNGGVDSRQSLADLARFIDERWKGMRPVAWGSTLSEAQLTQMIYNGLCGINDKNFPLT